MKSPLTNEQVITELKKASAVLSATDTSPVKVFRVRAYENAIESIENLDEELASIIQAGRLDEIKSLGPELSQKITDLITLGHSLSLDKLFALVPGGMFALLEIPGIGPKKAYKLAVTFHLTEPQTALGLLTQHLDQGDLANLDGFGGQSIQQLRENISQVKPKSFRMRLDLADALARQVISLATPLSDVLDIQILGSLRRRLETVGDVDLVVITKNPDSVVKQLSLLPLVKVKVSGENVIRLILPGNKQADIKFQTPEKAGAALQHFTGSKAHNIALREFALKKGLSLSEHGIKSNGKLKPYATEKAFYQALGLPLIPPELRENQGEIPSAQSHRLPKLVDMKDILGDTHTHTDFPMHSSHDFGMPIKDLLDFAVQHHYKWLAIGDHNPSQSSYTASKLLSTIKDRNSYIEQTYYSWKALHRNRAPIILITLEVDILPDGSLALPDGILTLLDFVIVSVHSRFNLPQKLQTVRLLKALQHPKVKILGHPTGRLINSRPAINADWDQIFSLCAKRHIALEINASPARLDLPDSLVRVAVDKGVKLAIGSDAHKSASLADMPYGVGVARRGWAAKHDIINTYSYSELQSWLN